MLPTLSHNLSKQAHALFEVGEQWKERSLRLMVQENRSNPTLLTTAHPPPSMVAVPLGFHKEKGNKQMNAGLTRLFQSHRNLVTGSSRTSFGFLEGTAPRHIAAIVPMSLDSPLAPPQRLLSELQLAYERSFF